MTTALLVKILIVLAILVVVYLARRRRPAAPGGEYAGGLQVEGPPVARGPSESSSLPQGQYSQGHHNLADPRPIPFDDALRELVTRYGTSDDAARASMRDSLSTDDMYTLATFSKRAAAFGMRDRDPSWIESGLTAVAMFDATRMDPRDVQMTLSSLHHAAGADAAPLFAKAAELAPGQVAADLRAFAGRKDTGLVEHWGTSETPTGFIGHGGERWAPTRDLQGAILRIAAVVDADGREQVSGVEIADTPPLAFFPESARLLRKARATATFHTSVMNGLMGFLVEMPDADGAAAMQKAASSGTRSIGFARGNLFCFLLSSDETPQSLQRFAAPISEILDTTS